MKIELSRYDTKLFSTLLHATMIAAAPQTVAPGRIMNKQLKKIPVALCLEEELGRRLIMIKEDFLQIPDKN